MGPHLSRLFLLKESRRSLAPASSDRGRVGQPLGFGVAYDASFVVKTISVLERLLGATCIFSGRFFCVPEGG